MGTSRVKVLKHTDSYYTTIYEPRVLPVESIKEDHQVNWLGPSLPATSLWPAGLNTGKPPAKRSPRAGGVFPPRALLLVLPPSLLVPFEPEEKRQEDELGQLSGPFSLQASTTLFIPHVPYACWLHSRPTAVLTTRGSN